MEQLFECSDVTVKFGGLKALDGLSMTIDSGCIVGLIGPNGSGKTTFFNTITGLVEPTAGEVNFGGDTITGLAPRKIYQRGITRTFQRSRLCLTMSVFDNLVMGNQSQLNLNLFTNLFNRSKFLSELKLNYESARSLLAIFSEELADQIFEPVERFTMIDRRRIEVCRALISEPRLVLLDEPSAGMTTDETKEFMEDILKIRTSDPEMSIVIIEHEMDVIQRVADTCVVLNFGEKVAEGIYSDVVADPWVQAAYLGIE